MSYLSRFIKVYRIEHEIELEADGQHRYGDGTVRTVVHQGKIKFVSYDSSESKYTSKIK